MKIRLIRKANKISKTIKTLSLIFGIVSVLLIATINSGNLIMKSIQILTVISIAVGLISLNVGYYMSKLIEIDVLNVKVLSINSNKTQKGITCETSIEYLGNWLTLDNGEKYEIHRTDILKLLQKLMKIR